MKKSVRSLDFLGYFYLKQLDTINNQTIIKRY